MGEADLARQEREAAVEEEAIRLLALHGDVTAARQASHLPESVLRDVERRRQGEVLALRRALSPTVAQESALSCIAAHRALRRLLANMTGERRDASLAKPAGQLGTLIEKLSGTLEGLGPPREAEGGPPAPSGERQRQDDAAYLRQLLGDLTDDRDAELIQGLRAVVEGGEAGGAAVEQDEPEEGEAEGPDSL